MKIKFDDMMDFNNYMNRNNFTIRSSNYVPEESILITIKNNQFHECEEYYFKDRAVYRVKNTETASKTKIWEDNFEKLIMEVKSKHPDVKLEQISFYLNQFLNEKKTLNDLVKYIDNSMNK